jgi:hypothetical protein
MSTIGTSEFFWGAAIAVPFVFVGLALLYAFLTRPKDHHPHPGE